MLKHILTTKCTRKCEYCITRNVKVEQVCSLKQVEELYLKLSKEHKQIMLTGGEPTIAKLYYEIRTLAVSTFKEVYLTTQNRKVLNFSQPYDAITFSLHEISDIPFIQWNNVVYASILANQYFDDLPYILKRRGYAGLAINEDQRKNQRFTISLPEIPNFSYKINRRGHCMDETIILPDLTVIKDFHCFL